MKLQFRLLSALTLVGLVGSGCDGKSAASGRPEPTRVQVEATRLVPGPVVHAELTPRQLERLKVLHSTFAEVDPSPFERWVDDFKRDANPDNEIAIYEAMATAYVAYCRERSLSLEAKQDVYQIVLLRSAASEDDVLRSLKLKAISLDEARVVLRGYTAPASPIKVAPAR